MSVNALCGAGVGARNRHVRQRYGHNANACTRAAPCRTVAGAIVKTEAGGEIFTLEPGAYGNVTITKSISVTGVEGASLGSVPVPVPLQ